MTGNPNRHIAAVHSKATLRRFLNVCLVIALFGLAAVLVVRYTENRAPILSPSAKISIPGIDLAKTPHTLLLAVSRDCEYCAASARFYRWLNENLAGRTDVRLVALFPDSETDGQWYLKTLGLQISEASQTSLPALGITHVPTLALVDANGIVKNVWIGQLPPKKEAEVMQALAIPNARPPTEWVIAANEFKLRLERGEQLLLVDLRPRDAYARNPLPKARNIPFDELYARAKNELSPERTVVLYSDDDAIADMCYMVLTRQRFPNVLILDPRL